MVMMEAEGKLMKPGVPSQFMGGLERDYKIKYLASL
jgi:hypothetical protein